MWVTTDHTVGYATWVTVCGYVTGFVMVRFRAMLRRVTVVRYADTLRRCVTVRYGTCYGASR